jgi:hypothetical protein
MLDPEAGEYSAATLVSAAPPTGDPPARERLTQNRILASRRRRIIRASLDNSGSRNQIMVDRTGSQGVRFSVRLRVVGASSSTQASRSSRSSRGQIGMPLSPGGKTSGTASSTAAGSCGTSSPADRGAGCEVLHTGAPAAGDIVAPRMTRSRPDVTQASLNAGTLAMLRRLDGSSSGAEVATPRPPFGTHTRDLTADAELMPTLTRAGTGSRC